MSREEIVQKLLQDPEKLLAKTPFYREMSVSTPSMSGTCEVGGKTKVRLPKIKYSVIDQSQYLLELNARCHTVLTDENIPSVCVKVKNNQYAEIQEVRMSLPYQQTIMEKHVLHLCANPMKHTLLKTNPNEKESSNFATIKKYWGLRNMDGLKTKMVAAQESVGDAGLLFYYNYKGEVHARVLNFPEYVIITHKDNNGDHCLECVYYCHNENEYIDCYDDTYIYRLTTDPKQGVYNEKTGWSMLPPEKHGFSEIPLIVKRGKVAWDDVQTLIEMFETLYNIFYVIQKRHGWGILYVKGKFTDTSKKIAGSVILNDRSLNNEKSDAKFLSAPTPDGTIQTLESLFNEIQIGAGATILLPKDIKSSGDISGIAIQMTQSRDIETALAGVVEWQNVADKMMRLFKEGLAKELVNSNELPTAITDFEELKIHSKFVIWRPFSETEYNQMLTTLKGAGLLSVKSGLELNTVAAPDELARIQAEEEKDFEIKLEHTKKEKELDNTITNTNE